MAILVDLCIGAFGLLVVLFIVIIGYAYFLEFCHGRQVTRRLLQISCSTCGACALRVIANPFAWADHAQKIMRIPGRHVRCANCHSFFFLAEWDDTGKRIDPSSDALNLIPIDAARVHRAYERGRSAKKRLAILVGAVLALLAAICFPAWWLGGIGPCEISLPIMLVFAFIKRPLDWVFQPESSEKTNVA